MFTGVAMRAQRCFGSVITFLYKHITSCYSARGAVASVTPGRKVRLITPTPLECSVPAVL